VITAAADWPTGPVQLEWHPNTITDLPVTGSHGFIFGETGILVARIESRGLSIPGGHLEEGESAEECLTREIGEEIQVEVDDLILLGYIVCDHSDNPDYQGPYDLRAAQAVFFGKVTRHREFHQTPEASERIEVASSDLPKLHHEWNDVLNAAFVAANRVANTT